jgi:hypothetical protein
MVVTWATISLFGWFRRVPKGTSPSQVDARILRYQVVDDRRVAKKPRKTLNDRRKAGVSTTSSEASTMHLHPESDGPLSLSEELIRLGCLRQAGLISEFEFDQEKARVLDQCRHEAGAGPEDDPTDLWTSRHRSEQH